VTGHGVTTRACDAVFCVWVSTLNISALFLGLTGTLTGHHCEHCHMQDKI